MTDLDAMLNTLSGHVKPVVEAIEASIPTTQNHYGQYMVALDKIAGQLSGNKPNQVYLAVGIALQRAGANKHGVEAALRALGKI